MCPLPAPHRDRFRAYPLDGALLWFQPSSGRSVRVQNERTRPFARQAPRVVMFGITNRCNLACTFCSRNVSRPSQWTVESATRVLQDLERAGTLEVAFGGGEPFAFRGFSELVSELHATTRLALNVTSNGLLLDERAFAPFRGRLGQVRLSIYDDPRWRAAASALSSSGQLWGANVLVDDQRLPVLPALFDELAALGCHDISLLGYVGHDPAAQLGPAGRERLAALISDAALPCRISVCFGDSLSVPRLFDGADGSGDCGAGRDFITLTPDQRVQSCSFQDGDFPADTAEQVLAVWRDRAEALRRASDRRGCSRRAPAVRREMLPPFLVWRAFSGNNSGECIMVGKFASGLDAERFVAELKPSWEPDGDYSEEWRSLFERENVALAALRDDGETCGQSPSTLVAVGRSVIARSYAAGDAFPELRALAWKRGGFVVAGGIHLHDSPSLLAAIRCRDAQDARARAAQAAALQTFAHGEVLFVLVSEATREKTAPFEAHVRSLADLAAGRPLGAELVLHDWDLAAFLAAKQRLGAELRTQPRLLIVFYGGDGVEKARRFADQLTEATAHVCGSAVLVEGVQRRKRAAVLGLRQGGFVSAIDGTELNVHGSFWMLQPPRTKGIRTAPLVLDVDAVVSDLSAALGSPVKVEIQRNGTGQVVVTTTEPGRVLRAMALAADRAGAQINPWVSDVDPTLHLLQRLMADVRE
jgi:MoaA/NifB/PqqE/SkfB family radical SAM enzyme